MLVHPILVACEENVDDRFFAGETFGELDGNWATVIGFTMANRLDEVRGKAWSGGAGNWKMPWRLHPTTLDPWIELRVCSPRFEEFDESFRKATEMTPLIQRAYDYEAAVEHGKSVIDSIGPVEGSQLVDILKPFFWMPED